MRKKVSLLEASLVLLIILCCISMGVIVFKLSPNVVILFAIAITIGYMVIRRMPLEWVNEGIVSGLKPGIIPIFIFLLVGALIAVWIQAGIIPTIMVIGFKLLSVKWFIPSIFLVCAIVGSAVGSAFTVMSTIGIAFFGIGVTLGLNPPLIVGAIASGAIFGDKMSPLSESTNLASAVVEADLFDHIKNMMWSTIPAFLVSFILFTVIGKSDTTAELLNVKEVTQVLEANFHISMWSLIPILLMLICAWKKLPAIMTILLNVVVAVGMIVIQQGKMDLVQLANVIENGFVSKTGNEQVDMLLTRGGINSMTFTVLLIILTLSLGGILMRIGLVTTVIDALSTRLTSPKQLIIVSLLSSIGVNIFIGEQLLSVILPGNAFKDVYKKMDLDPVVLSRTLEDGGTVINYLIPWGIAGSFVANTFGVPTMSYMPFVFFSLLSPVFSILSALTGIGVRYIKKVAD